MPAYSNRAAETSFRAGLTGTQWTALAVLIVLSAALVGGLVWMASDNGHSLLFNLALVVAVFLLTGATIKLEGRLHG